MDTFEKIFIVSSVRVSRRTRENRFPCWTESERRRNGTDARNGVPNPTDSSPLARSAPCSSPTDEFSPQFAVVCHQRFKMTSFAARRSSRTETHVSNRAIAYFSLVSVLFYGGTHSRLSRCVGKFSRGAFRSFAVCSALRPITQDAEAKANLYLIARTFIMPTACALLGTKAHNCRGFHDSSVYCPAYGARRELRGNLSRRYRKNVVSDFIYSKFGARILFRLLLLFAYDSVLFARLWSAFSLCSRRIIMLLSSEPFLRRFGFVS